MKRGFTLIELLVVIAIIALLFGMFLPTLAGIEKTSKLAHCQKNLLDIHKVLTAYSTMNDGWYPWKMNNWFGNTFYGQKNPNDLWAGLAHVNQLKQVGAGPEIFWCPFNPDYGDWDAWPANSWKVPFQPTWSSAADKVYVYVDYALLMYRGYPYHATFTDGRWPATRRDDPDNVPIVADRLHVRFNMQIHGGWHHGGGWPDGLWNSSCNTLFNDGSVVFTAAEAFDPGEPSIVMGSTSRDQFWFALER